MNTLVVTLALFAALLALAAGALTLLRRRRRPAESFTGMRDREFDERVGEAFRLQGYQLVEAARSGRDAQADLLLRRERESFVVLTRQRQAGKVGIDALQALQRTMTVHGAAGGFALTQGRFSRKAMAFAEGCNIRLVDGAALKELLARGAAASRPAAAPHTQPER